VSERATHRHSEAHPAGAKPSCALQPATRITHAPIQRVACRPFMRVRCIAVAVDDRLCDRYDRQHRWKKIIRAKLYKNVSGISSVLMLRKNQSETSCIKSLDKFLVKLHITEQQTLAALPAHAHEHIPNQHQHLITGLVANRFSYGGKGMYVPPSGHSRAVRHHNHTSSRVGTLSRVKGLTMCHSISHPLHKCTLHQMLQQQQHIITTL